MEDRMTFDELHYILRALITSFVQTNCVHTPILLFSDRVLEKNIAYFLSTVIVDKIYFPVKTNNHPDVLKVLNNAGVSFEIASLGELQLLEKININPDNIIFGNPVKLDNHIEYSALMGIKTFSVDTESELMKIKKHVNNANIYLRLDVSNTGAEWELTEKFGCEVQDAVKLFQKAIDLEMNAVGISFHVGWNNPDTATWEQAVIKAYQLIKQCHEAKITLKFINIGGGFPAHLNNQYEALGKIARIINPHLSRIKAEFNMEVYAEPGSFLSANAGIVISRVINITRRKDKFWVYLDTGINHGFSWIMSGLEYAIFPPGATQPPLTEYIVCGPTCDSHDLFSRHTFLSSQLKEDDLLLIYPAGAYISSSENYNGFAFPVTRVG